MRGQYADYNSFNLIDMIDELKTRISDVQRVDNILHGMMVVTNNYHDLCSIFRDMLMEDDKKGMTDSFTSKL